jgi:cystathionine beta-lyase/cystathionine gamma-synthase
VLNKECVQNAEGTGLGPFDCWLAMRGLKTMALRMERQAANADIIALWLQAHPLARKVNYPGLPSHPGHAVHATQASSGGSLLSFETGRQAPPPPCLGGPVLSCRAGTCAAERNKSKG